MFLLGIYWDFIGISFVFYWDVIGTLLGFCILLGFYWSLLAFIGIVLGFLLGFNGIMG